MYRAVCIQTLPHATSSHIDCTKWIYHKRKVHIVELQILNIFFYHSYHYLVSLFQIRCLYGYRFRTSDSSKLFYHKWSMYTCIFHEDVAFFATWMIQVGITKCNLVLWATTKLVRILGSCNSSISFDSGKW